MHAVDAAALAGIHQYHTTEQEGCRVLGISAVELAKQGFYR